MKSLPWIILIIFVSWTISKAEKALAKDLYGYFLEAHFMYYYFDYEEDLPSPIKSTEKRWLPGINLEAGYQGVKDPFYCRLLLEYTKADTDYDGTTMTGVPAKDKTENKFTTWEVDIGYNFKQQKNLKVDLISYTGLGYRHWERRLGGLSPYSEEYSWK